MFAVNAHLLNAVEKSSLKISAKEKEERNYCLDFLRLQPEALLKEM